MKQIVILAATLFLSFTSIEESIIDRIGVKGPLTFDKIDFKLAWTDKPNEKYYIQEYLPGGETIEAFNQMLTIHLFVTEDKLKDAVKQKTKELTQRKKTDPVCNYLVTESPDGKEFIVDFLLGESRDDKMTIVEFNVYRYKQIDLGQNKKGILVYTYSERAYDDKITPFLESLEDNRTKHLNQMIETEIPSVKIEGK
jgi:hypothetical protein